MNIRKYEHGITTFDGYEDLLVGDNTGYIFRIQYFESDGIWEIKAKGSRYTGFSTLKWWCPYEEFEEFLPKPIELVLWSQCDEPGGNYYLPLPSGQTKPKQFKVTEIV